ncbi:hypothetical protein POUND7_003614, partial [Theobroma cacao]
NFHHTLIKFSDLSKVLVE